MKGKEFTKIARKLLALVFVFSLLQSHLVILNEFAGTAYAAIESSIDEKSTLSSTIEEELEFEEDLNEGESFDTQVENEIEYEQTVESKEENVTNTEIRNETADDFNQSDDIVVENTTIDSNGEATDDNDSDVEDVAEKINSSLKIVDTYRSLNGIVIRTNIKSDGINLKDAVKESKITVAMPLAEGYTVQGVYLENEDIDSEESALSLTTSEESDMFFVSILNDTTSENFECDYTLVFVLEGTGEVTELSLELEVALIFEGENILSDLVSLCEEVNLDKEEQNEYSITSQNTSIYKGYLYANAVSTKSYETKYTSIDKLEIKSLDNIDVIVLTEDVSKIKTKDDTEVSLEMLSEYKTTLVEKESFDKLFGEDGYIEIWSNEQLLGRIDSNTNVEDGMYVYEYDTRVDVVEFKLNMVKEVGSLEILNNKVIKKIAAFDRAQIMNFYSIEQNLIVKEIAKVVDNEIVLSLNEQNVNIVLEDTESRMDLQMSVDTLSASVDNDVTFTITLRTNEEKYELFKNPEIQIELPSDIKEVELVNTNLLYKNGLSIDTVEVVDGEFGKKIIVIKLVGTQVEYTPGLVANGTTINLYTKLKLNRMTTNKDSKIEFKYTNEINSKIAYEVEGKKCEELSVKIVSRTGLLRALSVNNNLTGESVISYDNELGELRLEDHKTNQVIKYSGTIVNNFEETLSNVQVIGRFPVRNDDNGDLEDLISTFDATLNSEVITSGSVAEVFYSEDADAGKDDDSWTKNLTDLSKIKSFKIVLSNTQMNQGESLEFSCDIRVLDDLDNNQKGYFTYNVYYDLAGQTLYGHCTTKVVTDEKDISIDDIPDEGKEEVADLVIGSVVTMWQRQLSEGESVYERQVLEYTIVVTNNSNLTARNINIQANAENANLYYFRKWIEPSYQGGGDYEIGQYEEDINNQKIYEEFSIDTLNPGESKVFKYQVIVKDLKDISNPEVYGKIKVTGDNFEEKNIETIKNKIIDGDISVLVAYGATENVEDSKVYTQGPLRFKVAYSNISDKVITNANMKIFISDEVELNVNAPIEGAEEYEKSIIEVVDGTIVNIVIPYMNPGETYYLDLYTIAKDFDIYSMNEYANIYAVVEYNGAQYYSNNYLRDIYQARTKIDYSWHADRDSNDVLVDGDKVMFTLNLKNSGLVSTNELDTSINIDDGFKLQNVYVTKNGTVTQIDGSKYKKIMIYELEIGAGEEVKIQYEFVVDESLFEVNQSIIETRVNVTSSRIDDFVTDVIQFKIKNDLVEGDVVYPNGSKNPSNSNNSSNSDSNANVNQDGNIVENTYKVFGKVWLDKNKDGIYTEDEGGIQGIGVYAYGAGDNEVYMSNIYGSTRTDKDGKYEICNLPAGKYIIAFGYDTSIYTVTKYQNTKAKSNENSDVINKDIYGEKINIGVTDTIEIIDRAAENIDMGLIQINEFDMALEKYIAKTIVRNSKGVVEQNYGEEDLVKLEINSKVFENSVVDIEYKIVVKNEGELDGYINKIVDYIPDGLSFNKELNTDWSIQDDGKLVYTGLMEKSIKAGETREISLILSIDINDTKTKQVVNSAEILDITNDRGFQDIDSIAGNAVEYEDDLGNVALLITVSTGRIINYTLIIISIISFMSVLILGRLLFKEKIYK